MQVRNWNSPRLNRLLKMEVFDIIIRSAMLRCAGASGSASVCSVVPCRLAELLCSSMNLCLACRGSISLPYRFAHHHLASKIVQLAVKRCLGCRIVMAAAHLTCCCRTG